MLVDTGLRWAIDILFARRGVAFNALHRAMAFQSTKGSNTNYGQASSFTIQYIQAPSIVLVPSLRERYTNQQH